MRKITYLALSFLAVTCTASAQSRTGETRIYAHGGVTIPLRPKAFTDLYYTGFHWGGAVTQRWPVGIEFGVAVTVARFNLYQEEYLKSWPGFTMKGGHTLSLNGSLVLKYHLRATDRIGSYVLFDAGLRVLETRGGRLMSPDSKFKILDEVILSRGAAVGFGVRWEIASELELFVDVRHELLFGARDRMVFLPVTSGIAYVLD